MIRDELRERAPMTAEEKAQLLGEIGARVRKLRRAKGWRQDDLSDAAGLSKSFISEIENGLSGATGLVYLRLADALGVGIEFLLRGARPGSPLTVECTMDDATFRQFAEKLQATLESAGPRHPIVAAPAPVPTVPARLAPGDVRWYFCTCGFAWGCYGAPDGYEYVCDRCCNGCEAVTAAPPLEADATTATGGDDG